MGGCLDSNSVNQAEVVIIIIFFSREQVRCKSWEVWLKGFCWAIMYNNAMDSHNYKCNILKLILHISFLWWMHKQRQQQGNHYYSHKSSGLLRCIYHSSNKRSQKAGASAAAHAPHFMCRINPAGVCCHPRSSGLELIKPFKVSCWLSFFLWAGRTLATERSSVLTDEEINMRAGRW